MTNSTLHDLVTTIGTDLGKNSFHLIGMGKHGKILWRQKLARGLLEERLANRRPAWSAWRLAPARTMSADASPPSAMRSA